MAKEFWGAASKREWDRICRAVRIAERIEPRPKRGRRPSRSGGENAPIQLAVVTSLALEAAYSGSDLTFEISYNTAGRALLLRHDVSVEVDTTTGSTLEELEFAFRALNRDAPINVGDVIRVWRSDGSPVTAGDTGASSTDIFGEYFNATEHLRGLPGYDPAPAEPIFLQSDADELYWDLGSGIPGPQGDPGTPGANGADGADGPGVDPGYAIDVTGTDPRVVGFDPTEITGFSNASFQFFAHDTSAGETTDPDDPPWKSVTGYDNTKTQLMGHINGTWHAKTIAEWLNLLANYAAGSDQIIGHAADGATEWKTLTSKTLNHVTDADLNLTSSLDLEVDYTPVTVKLWPAASDGTPANFTDSVAVDPCD